jgi:hypothetical protein
MLEPLTCQWCFIFGASASLTRPHRFDFGRSPLGKGSCAVLFFNGRKELRGI